MVRPQTSVFVAAVLSVGCGGSSGSAGPSALGQSPTLRGQVVNWASANPASSTMTIMIDNGDGHSSTTAGATGTVDANGNFTIVLPDQMTMQPLLRPFSRNAIAPSWPTRIFQVSDPD